MGLGSHYGFSMQWGDYGTGDWMAYWSTPRAVLLNQGYFDFAWQRATQVSVGYDRIFYAGHYYPVWRLWNPPPLVTLLMPMSGLGFTTSTLAWLGLSAVLYTGAAVRLSRSLPHRVPKAAVILLSLFFVPFFGAMRWGQVTPVLAALLIYAWAAQRNGRHTAAGILLVPVLLKPHLFLVALALMLLVALRQRQWRMLGSFVGMGLFLSGCAFLLDPQWLANWLKEGSPSGWLTFSLWDMGSVLFDLPGWFQFVGIPLGLCLTLWRYRHTREVTPHLIGEAMLLSILFSPYVWSHDVVVLMPAAVCIASQFWGLRLQAALLFQTIVNAGLTLTPALSERTPWLFVAYVLVLWHWSSQRTPARSSLSPGTSLSLPGFDGSGSDVQARYNVLKVGTVQKFEGLSLDKLVGTVAEATGCEEVPPRRADVHHRAVEITDVRDGHGALVALALADDVLPITPHLHVHAAVPALADRPRLVAPRAGDGGA